MAREWIKWVKGLYEKPEVLQMAFTLKMPTEKITVGLMKVWEWADEVTDDGFVPGVSPDFIDCKADIEGLAEEMSHVGWLSVSGDGLTFPNWDRHNSQSARRRLLDSRRQADKRGKNVRKRSGQMSASERDECHSESPSPSSSPSSPLKEGGCKGGEVPYPPGVDVLYKSYPRHSGGKKDKEAIAKALIRNNGKDDLWAIVKRYAAAVQGKDKKFIPHAATWFNQERWKQIDEIESEEKESGDGRPQHRIDKAKQEYPEDDNSIPWLHRASGKAAEG